MGTPARHERYPEVIHICRVIPNLCSQAEDPLGIYRSAALRAALGGAVWLPRRLLPGAKGEVSAAIFNLVSLKHSEDVPRHSLPPHGCFCELWLQTEESFFLLFMD